MPSRSPSSARSSRALYAPRLKPLAQAIALLLVAGGAQAAGQPFSAAWFAAKGAAQGGAAVRNCAPCSTRTAPAASVKVGRLPALS